ncbi:unnamed protein product, partial [Cyprideis torosa]
DEAVIFMKPASALAQGSRLRYPSHGADLHHEAEIVVRVARDGVPVSDDDAATLVGELALGLDMTLRDVQSRLKKAGLPWEKAKAFDDSAAVGPFIAADGIDLADISLQLAVNGQLRQAGSSAMMLRPIPQLLREVAAIWPLQKGDLIFTGTPAGVAAVGVGDRLTLSSPQLPGATWQIVDRP